MVGNTNAYGGGYMNLLDQRVTNLENHTFAYVNGTSVNSINTNGIYYGSFADSPDSASTYGFLIVSEFPNADFRLQLFFSQKWGGNVGVYCRTSQSASVWYAWKTLH